MSPIIHTHAQVVLDIFSSDGRFVIVTHAGVELPSSPEVVQLVLLPGHGTSGASGASGGTGGSGAGGAPSGSGGEGGTTLGGGGGGHH